MPVQYVVERHIEDFQVTGERTFEMKAFFGKLYWKDEDVNGKIDHILLTTEKQIKYLCAHGNIVCLDGTHNTTYLGYQLGTVLVRYISPLPPMYMHPLMSFFSEQTSWCGSLWHLICTHQIPLLHLAVYIHVSGNWQGRLGIPHTS
jgi:hypothetical protein